VTCHPRKRMQTMAAVMLLLLEEADPDRARRPPVPDHSAR
jgi:hypothetical protein